MCKLFVHNKSNHVTIYKILFVDTECRSSAVSGSAPDGHQHEGCHCGQHQQREAHLTHAPQQRQVHLLTLLTPVLSRHYAGLRYHYAAAIFGLNSSTLTLLSYLWSFKDL